MLRLITISIVALVPALGFANNSGLQNGLLDCSRIASDVKRLACFDELAPPLNQQASTSPTMPAEKPKQPELPANTGAERKQPGEKYLYGKNNADKAPAIYKYTLTRAKKDNRGRWLFYFSNGQVWSQLEAKPLPRPKPVPMKATISEAIMGSYSLRLGDGQRSIKVRRLR
ncbi:MAG: hypothetical protein GY712_06360 [Oceanicoccus sp.]|uniref:hypothetical protein n=1 Tax=Oceanicoccus sp. TaxID=2691044 RepID=UPI00236B8C6E|nr:hypothetical protein [Oceanicoccus sp.]MCP3907622.1 hypothetical protein [Oceanicoccus sp.]MDB4528474.1 hypothetical protein [Pseudomonadales bacterium]MDG1773592.1 hypothetical protein [Oceanicoccus sp.]